MRWEEPHHPGPGLQLDRHSNPLSSHFATRPHNASPFATPALGCPRERGADRTAAAGAQRRAPGRRQRPARLPLPAPARQAAHLDPDRDRGGRDRRRPRRLRRAGDRRSGRPSPPSCSACWPSSRSPTRAPSRASSRPTPPRTAWNWEAATRCPKRPRCCARATTATPSARSPAPLPTTSRASSPSTPTRRRAPTPTATGRPTTTTTRSAWSRCPSAPRTCPSSTAGASRACARWRSSRTPSARPSGCTLESEALDERYEIFSGKEQDQVWLRRLFSPTFVVWLGEEAPKKFAFELVAGIALLLRQRPQEVGR